MNASALGLVRLPHGCIRLALAACAIFSPAVVAQGQAPAKPEFQYVLDDVRVSIPTADEPRVKAFGPESLKAAAKYLEVGAVSWVRGRACVNCHTTGPYMSEYLPVQNLFTNDSLFFKSGK